jgi:hypothetical protein
LHTFNWNGLNAFGAPLASGSYLLKAAGQGPGHSDLQFSFTILASPGASVAAPHIAPNPVPASALTLTVLAPGGPNPWQVDLYDLAGGLVAAHFDAPGVNATLPIASLSSGIYLAVVRTRDSQGQAKQWTLKAAILR